MNSNALNRTFAYHLFCPYRVCPLGAHVDHQHGIVTGFALDTGITFEYTPTEDGSIFIQSANYQGTAAGSVTDEYERRYTWVDFVFGAVQTLRRQYRITRGVSGILSGTLTAGGLSSSASVILTYLLAFCKANDIQLTAPELVRLAVFVEHTYIGVNVGKLDQSCEVYCRKNSLLYLDTLDDSAKLLPQSPAMPAFEIAVIFSGMERKLAGSAYNMRVDECKAAAYALKDFARLEYGRFADTRLRDIPQGIYEEYRSKLPPSWCKRADHYYGEMERVKKGIAAWQHGDLAAFGSLVFESGTSSIQLYETGSEELQTLHTLMQETDGIYGGRFSGAGFNGSAMAIVDPAKKEDITAKLTAGYLARYPALKDSFFIRYCKTADGVNMQ